MKSTIRGTVYDTKTARLIAEAENDDIPGTPGWWKAGLYETARSNRFFLAGEGGVLTRFWKNGDGQTGQRIIPIDPATASDIETCYT